MNALHFFRKVRIALTPRRSLLKARLSNGAVVYGRNRAGHGGRGVYIWRDAIEPELEHLEELLSAGDVFVDVGANTGVYTLKAAARVGAGGTVIAIEPFPDVFAILAHSVRANSFDNVRLRNLCLGARTSERTLWLNARRPSLFSIARRTGSAAGLSVLAVCLDDLLEWEDLRRLDYLKIDTEGAEEEILAGASRSIEKFRPIIQAEHWDKIFTATLPEYRAFRAAGSSNIVYVPAEHPRLDVPARLGWRHLTSDAADDP